MHTFCTYWCHCYALFVAENCVFLIAKNSALLFTDYTYHKCLSELVAYGYVEYRPSWHPAKGSRFRLIIHREGGTDGEG